MAYSQWHGPTIGPFVVCRCVFMILSTKAMVCLLPQLVHEVSATRAYNINQEVTYYPTQNNHSHLIIFAFI